MKETWKTVASNPMYSVSNHGRVRRDVGGQGARSGHILSPGINGNGYLMVHPSNGSRCEMKSIHTLVALAFLGPPPDGKTEVNHKDGNPLNNKSSNLEWVTRSENVQHAYRTGLVNSTLRRGEKNWQAKLTNEAVIEIRRRRVGLGALAAKFGVSLSSVKDAAQRRSWRHIP